MRLEYSLGTERTVLVMRSSRERRESIMVEVEVVTGLVARLILSQYLYSN